MSKPELKDIEVESIRIDGGTQPRAQINLEVVAEYATAFESGANFPPCDVFHDGTEYWLADGFHRWHGARKAKMDTLDCRVHHGTQRDAVLFSVGANSSHGLRRSNDDKRKAVMVLLNDGEWGGWSAREIADHCCVGHSFVSELRQTLSTADSVSDFVPNPTAVKFKTKTGKTSTKTVNPKPPKPKKTDEPAKPASSIDPVAAREAEILRTTAPKPSQFVPEEFDQTMAPEWKRPAKPPRKTDNGDLTHFDASEQRSWREAYGQLHRMLAQFKKRSGDDATFAVIDKALGEFYYQWVENNPGKWC